MSPDTHPTQSGEISVPRRVNHRIYRACVGVMSEHASLRIEAALDRVADLLKADSIAAVDEESAENIRRSLVALRAGRTEIRAGFARELLARLEFKVACGLRTKLTAGGKGLSLQAGEVIDEYVAASSLAHLIDSECLDQMMPMHQRVTRLLREPSLRMAQNPFSAPSIVSALDASLSALSGVSQDFRTQWLRRMTSLGGLGFHSLYIELNRILEEGGVDDFPSNVASGRPRSQDEVRGVDSLPPSVASEVLTAATAETPVQADPLHVLAGHLSALVSRLQRANPSRLLGSSATGWPQLGGDDGANISAALGITSKGNHQGPVASGYDRGLLDSLTSLQAANAALDNAELAFEPRVGLRETVPGYATGEISVLDATTIELVSMLFEFVFERRELRDEVKGVLGRLQIPMLKAAMVDRGFFSRKNHPARMLLNRLADVGLGWSPDNPQEAPLFAKIQTVVNQICRDFVDDLSVFTDAQSDLEQFVAMQELDAQPLLDARTAEAEAADRALMVAREVQSIVDARLSMHALPEPVVQFIQETWRPHIRATLLEHGKESVELAEAVAAMDDLIWSVQPKLAPQSRHDLGQRIPSLIRRLRANEASATSRGATPCFFDQLFEVHLGLLRGAEPDYVELTDLVDETEAPPEDSFHELVAQLSRGQWIEIEGDKNGELRYARLTWISPQRTSYLFTTRLGGKASIFSAVELAEKFRLGRIQMLDSEPIIDRALMGMFADV